MLKKAQDLLDILLTDLSKNKIAIRPELINPLYISALELDEKVHIHANGNVFPEKLLKERAPRQMEEEYNYMKGAYQPETMPIWQMAISNTNRILNEQNYSVIWDKQEFSGDIPEKYFTENYPGYRSIFSFADNVLKPTKINYPNSVVAIKPLNMGIYRNIR